MCRHWSGGYSGLRPHTGQYLTCVLSRSSGVLVFMAQSSAATVTSSDNLSIPLVVLFVFLQHCEEKPAVACPIFLKPLFKNWLWILVPSQQDHVSESLPSYHLLVNGVALRTIFN